MSKLTLGEKVEALELKIHIRTVDVATDLEKYAKLNPLGAADLQRRVVRHITNISNIRTIFTLIELEEMGIIQKSY